jgi:hypothetical protein
MIDCDEIMMHENSKLLPSCKEKHRQPAFLLHDVARKMTFETGGFMGAVTGVDLGANIVGANLGATTRDGFEAETEVGNTHHRILTLCNQHGYYCMLQLDLCL